MFPLTIVFMDRSLLPVQTGRRPDTAEQITALLDYDAAGKHGRDLSDKMVHCQIALATGGFSTGGRAPFAFDRWLVRRDGERIRQLEDGEILRMAGHHAVWLPAEDERLSLVDVREESEWGRGHLPGAEHLGKGIIERDVEEKIPDQSEKIVLYCGGGYRSALAADNLLKMGYTNVISMDGGFRGWKEAGLEIVQP